jgi:AcrR family transcriptional regulator
MTASRKPRVRRAPEDARVHILDAADAVFARELPDAVGLRDIAEEAGVSHGLVTHYFGTYDGVIAAAIDRRLARAQETAFARLAQLTFAADEIPLLGVLTDLLADRTLTRLVVWSFLTGRDSAVMRKDAQLGRLVDLMHARLTAIGVAIPRARLELSILISITSVIGWSIAGPALERAMGHVEGRSATELRDALQQMLRAYLTI